MTRDGYGRRRTQRLVVLGVVALLVPARGQGQGGSGQARSSWLWTTTGEYSWDSNVLYSPAETEQSDNVRRLNTSLRAVRARARSSLDISASGSAIRYQTLRALNLFSWDVTAGANRRVSANTRAGMSVFYRNLLAGDTRVTTAPSTLLLQRTEQRSIGGGASIDRRLTPFMTASASAGYNKVSFNTPGVIDGSALNGLAALRRQLRRVGSIGASFSVEQGNAQGIPLRTQSLSAEWASRIKSINIALNGGVTRLANGPTARFTGVGGVQLSDSIGFGSLSGGYTRSVSQAFGLGTLLETDGVSVSYDFQARRGNFVNFSGFWGVSRASTGGPELKSLGSSLGVRRVLPSGLTAGASASYRQREDIVRASGYSASVQLGYTFPNAR